jgi:YidC/Oxa1 family membrane protein insertase
MAAVRSQNALQKIQPKIQELQKKYKDDREKQGREMLELYKTEKINPFSGLLLSLIQLPILIALYSVFWHGLNPEELSVLYPFVQNPGQISAMFFNIVDLSKPNMVFALLAGLVQYFQTKMLTPKKTDSPKNTEPDISQIMQKQMLYFFPGFTVIILLGLPSALGLYWIVGGLFSIVQQSIILKKKTN